MKNFSRGVLRFLHKILGNKGLWNIPFVPTIYEFVYGLLSTDKLLTIDYLDFKLTLYEKDSGCGRLLTVNNDYEKYELDFFKKKIKKDNIVFDVGANIGIYSLVACKKLNNSGCVYAFEPAPFNYKLLDLNLKQNKLENYVLENKSVSDKNESKEFYLDKYQFGNHSLIKSNTEHLGSVINVDTVSLDKYCEENNISFIDVIKIDIQGAEPLLLKGAEMLLSSRLIGKIFIEYWPPGLESGVDLVELIEAYGYKVYFIEEHNHKIKLSSKEDRKESSCYNLYCEL